MVDQFVELILQNKRYKNDSIGVFTKVVPRIWLEIANFTYLSELFCRETSIHDGLSSEV